MSNPYEVDEFSVVTSALRAESKKWSDMSRQMQSIATAASHLTLGLGAFFAGPSPDFYFVSKAYDGFQAEAAKILGEGATEFEQMSTVLSTFADNYETSDDSAALDIDKIFSV